MNAVFPVQEAQLDLPEIKFRKLFLVQVRMKAISLFTGVGGLDLGLRP